MNLGLSADMKTYFPNITPVIRPKRTDEELLNSNIDPHWMVGFTDAEGCYSIRITKSLTTKTGYQVQLRYQITQHSIDKVFMNSLANFWGCGKVFLRYRENKVDFQILKFKDLTPQNPLPTPKTPASLRFSRMLGGGGGGGGQVCGGLRGARVLRTRAPPRGGR